MSHDMTITRYANGQKTILTRYHRNKCTKTSDHNTKNTNQHSRNHNWYTSVLFMSRATQK